MSPLETIPWPKGRLGVAFSAGKDSTALLALARQAYPKQAIFALHIDHQARSVESCHTECEFADNICEQLGVPLQRVALEKSLKSEAAWREARYLALAKLGREFELDWIATAHHSLDQSETILLNLLRGTNLNGLKGMAETWTMHQQNFCRPLLKIEPDFLYQHLDELQLKPFSDPSNKDNQYKRNHLRNEILPKLEAIQPGSLKRIAQLGSSIEKTIQWQNQEYQKHTAKIIPEERSELEIAFDRIELMKLPEPLLDMWCHDQLCNFAGGASKITRQHVESLAKFINSKELGYLNQVFPGEIQVRGRKKKVVFRKLSDLATKERIETQKKSEETI